MRRPTGKPGRKKSGSTAQKRPQAKRKKKSHIDWEPLKETRYQGEQNNDAERMTVDERKAAQLAKWKKELGLEEEE